MSKHTYIFTPEDGITEDDLYRLNKVVMEGPTSCRAKSNGRNYTEVEVFATPGDMHRLAHAAGFSGEQLRFGLPEALRRGHMAESEAAKRLDALRKRAAAELLAQKKRRLPLIPIAVEVRVKQLRAAGCEVTIERMRNGEFELVIFGESFVIPLAGEVFEFLRGVEKGFTSAPLWKCVSEVRITRRSKRSC